jgi:hypothetical protein
MRVAGDEMTGGDTLPCGDDLEYDAPHIPWFV